MPTATFANRKLLPLPRIDSTRRDGRRLACARVAHGRGTAAARVVFLHGITSHGGWYEQVARHLARRGFDVHFLDRRGSGLNARAAGRCRRLADVDRRCGRVCLRYATVVGGRRGRNRRICRRSCAGSVGAASWRRRLRGVMRGWSTRVALICPGIYSPFLPGFVKRAVLAAPAPQRLQQRRVKSSASASRSCSPIRRAGGSSSRSDPLALRSVTWRFAQEDRRLTRYARESAPFLHMPMLLMLAGQDRIVDNRRTRQFFGQIAGHRQDADRVSGRGHTLEFEADPTPYFADLADWIGAAWSRTAHANQR